MPGRGEGGDWGEVTSDLELHRLSRRAGSQTRFRRKGSKKNELVHTLNGTAVAIARALIALLENHQQADGSIAIPEALRALHGLRPHWTALVRRRAARSSAPRATSITARPRSCARSPASTPIGCPRRRRAASRSSSASRRSSCPTGPRLGVVDVPGHEALVRTMVVGRGGHRPGAARRGRRRGRDAADARAPRDLRAARHPRAAWSRSRRSTRRTREVADARRGGGAALLARDARSRARRSCACRRAPARGSTRCATRSTRSRRAPPRARRARARRACRSTAASRCAASAPVVTGTLIGARAARGRCR